MPGSRVSDPRILIGIASQRKIKATIGFAAFEERKHINMSYAMSDTGTKLNGRDVNYAKGANIGFRKYSSGFKSGDTVTMTVDFAVQTMSLRVGGRDHGVAFEDIDIGPSYYFCVGFNTKPSNHRVYATGDRVTLIDDSKADIDEKSQEAVVCFYLLLRFQIT